MEVNYAHYIKPIILIAIGVAAMCAGGWARDWNLQRDRLPMEMEWQSRLRREMAKQPGYTTAYRITGLAMILFGLLVAWQVYQGKL